MKKKFKLLIIAICIAFAAITLTVFAACPNGENGPNGQDPTLGTLTFNTSTLAGATVGLEYSTSVATATGAGFATVTYTLDATTPLPAGLNLSAAGAITGTPTTPTATAGTAFTVTASATGFNNASATFNIIVTQRALAFEGEHIIAIVNEPVDFDLVATGTEVVGVTYALAQGSELPEWLELDGDALVGTAQAATVEDIEFSITATATHFTPATADFTLEVISADEIGFSAVPLNAVVNRNFSHTLVAVAAGNPVITFAIYDNTLPANSWLTLENGVLSGAPTTSGDTMFSIVASANGFDNVVQEFTVFVTEANLETLDFAAVYTDLSYLEGGSDYGGVTFEEFNMIERVSDNNVIDNVYNYFLAHTHRMRPLAFTWVFYVSDIAPTTAQLYFSLGLAHNLNDGNATSFIAEFGNSIELNGVPLTFNDFYLPPVDASTATMQFNLYDIGEVTLMSGRNEIVLVLGNNTFFQGFSQGLAIDVLRLTTTAGVDWYYGPRTQNITNRFP